MTVPVAIIAPVAGLAIAIAKDKNAQANLGYIMTGYNDGKFDTGRVVMTYGPMLAGLVIHKAAGRFGLNRALANAGVPLIRI